LSRRILFEQLTDCALNVELQDDKIVFELKAPQHVTTPMAV
jgi:hypothetical protein